ncbi:glycosyltransferase [Mucilaginibacter terrae]|uniref:Sterol 3beta-glucosyltransferase n=1 Tax=Mucilaginibacter terrae TaxID=1955052 RepID=A0ABU3GYS0_9SPHI|nr:glycosyltransferase [Mucilaginibacter terrae]MDT3404908.1 sterol 3beta-glucosyltransferase [Mucilaginibacter terrae]
MHFGLFTYGSRGDVQPYMALALGLMHHGHQVTLAAPQNFKNLIEGYGISFHPLHGNAEELIYSPECLQVINSGNDVAFLKHLFSMLSNMKEPLLESMLSCGHKVDAFIVNNLGSDIYGAVAEKLGKKMMIVQLNPPNITTREFAMPGLDWFNMSWYNQLTYSIANAVLWKLAKKTTYTFRNLLQLPPLKQSVFKQYIEDKIPVIHAFSTELIKRPADWQEQHVVTGFLTLPQQIIQNNYTAQAELVSWLTRGDKPIYIGFGSIPVPDPEKLRGIIEQLLTATNHRIIFCTGWSHVPNLPQHTNLMVISQVNHQWLLPQCKTAVIHGGVGTLAAVLKAGIPVIIVSIFVDQPLWGKIIAKKKNGLHIPWRKLTAVKLLNAINKTADAQMQNEAKQAAKNINQQDGVKNAVYAIEQYLVKP